MKCVYFFPGIKLTKLLSFIQQKLKFRFKQGIYLKDEAFVQIRYEKNYLILRYGAKNQMTFKELEAQILAFMKIPQENGY